MEYGLKSNEVESIIRHSLNKNPDLKYYINDEYIDELISLLVAGVGQAIEANNEKVFTDIEREIRLKSRGAF